VDKSTADFADPTTLAVMTTTEPTTDPNPARWAPDPGVRGRLRYWDGTQWTPHTVDAITASRPELPSWFRSATHWLYAACGLTSAVCLAFALLGMAASADRELMEDVNSLAMTAITVLVLGAGAWAYTVAGSRRVDRSSLHREPAWLLAAWFVPIVHLVFPYQLFGEIWASARRIRTSRTGVEAATSLTAPRPWIMRVWVVAWALSSGGVFLLWLGGVELVTVIEWHLVANALMALLLGGVVRVIARELAYPVPVGTTVIP